MTRAATPLLAPRFVTGLEELAPRYDVILCDVWGVLHDGVTAAPAAGEALTRFRAEGGRVVLISNAPRPGPSVVRQLDRLRVPRTAFDDIVTSGDLTRTAVAERRDLVVHHLGPERDKAIFTGLDVRFGTLDDADYVVCTGLLDDDADTVDDYHATLGRMAQRELLMICANPDLVVERGHVLIPCAGALAQVYEELGGPVFYAGKPHGPVYEAALARAARIVGQPASRARVLGIGDAIRTDIAGASRAGIASLFVARGIHTEELGLREGALVSANVQDWLDRQEARPQAVIERLVWSAARA